MTTQTETIYLDSENVSELLNTGNELTAQCTSGELQELYLGVGPRAYMPKKDAEELLSPGDYLNACTHPDNLNPLYVYLDSTALTRLLDAHTFIILGEEE